MPSTKSPRIFLVHQVKLGEMLKKEKESAAPTYISFDRKDKGASFLGATDRKEKVKIKELVLFLLVPITSSWRAKRKKKISKQKTIIVLQKFPNAWKIRKEQHELVNYAIEHKFLPFIPSVQLGKRQYYANYETYCYSWAILNFLHYLLKLMQAKKFRNIS